MFLNIMSAKLQNRCLPFSLNLQVHNNQAAHDQDEAAHAGVVVHNAQEDTQSGCCVHPVQPVAVYVLLVFHHRATLGIHSQILICSLWVDERRTWGVLIGWQVVDGTLIG